MVEPARATVKGDLTMKVLGENLMRKDLHSDPFANREIELEAEKKAVQREKQIVDQRAFRQSLRDTVIEQTTNRIKHILGPQATPDNIKYCSEPMIQLLEQQSKLVEESRNEIDGLQKILESKQLDIAKLSSENDKFMQLNGGNRMWKEYELLLARERIVNRRLLAMFADKNNDDLLKEGRVNTYQEWLEQRAHIGSGDHNGTIFPRRRRSPKY